MGLMGNADLLERFEQMTLLELSEFVKLFEERFGVTAAAPVQMVEQPAEAEPVEEQEEFDVTLDSYGDAKIQVIKAVRSVLNLGLADAKAFTDNLPKLVLEKTTKDEAAKVAKLLTDAGGKVTVK